MRPFEYIEANKERLINRWKDLAVERLDLRLEDSQLIDDLPEFIDDLVVALKSQSLEWPPFEAAREHGRHRFRVGVDIGSLTREMALIGEVIYELYRDDDRDLSTDDMRRLNRVLARGTSLSVSEYAKERDEELAQQAADHYSFIAHELRTPLQTASMLVRLLERDDDQTNQEKYVARLQRALEKFSELIDNSLIHARLKGERELQLHQIDAPVLVNDAVDNVRDYMEQKNLVLTCAVENFTLEADEKLLASVLTNLLKNAVKFTHEGGKITVRASAEDGRATFEVADECGGMPPDLPARLFQPYVQGNSDKSGFGLGLKIVQRAVRAHRGSVDVDNRPGEGCTFIVDIPTRQGETGDR